MTVTPVHYVMSCFTYYFGKTATMSTKKQLAALGALVNEAVSEAGVIENAVSTCFLEHLRQVRACKPLSPFLAAAAKRRTHP